MKKRRNRVLVSSGTWCSVLIAVGTLAPVNATTGDNIKSKHEFNERGNILIAGQFNNRVIRASQAGIIVADYGLPLAGGDSIGNNVGYNSHTSQNGLYSPYDAKVVGDYTGLTPPFDFDRDADDLSSV
jgi:hypothetical protein